MTYTGGMEVTRYVVASSILVLLQTFQVLGQQTFSDSVSDIVNSVQDAVGYLQDYVGDRKGCRFECPNGSRPKVNPHHEPTSNGCGSFGFQLENDVKVEDLTKCCNDHDYCYDTCNAKKDACDRSFKRCLKRICKKIARLVSQDIYEGCLSAADMSYASTIALGCKPYRDAQTRACLCARSRHLPLHEEL